MVDQKKSEQIETISDDEPRDPGRRRFLGSLGKFGIASATILSGGGIYLLGRNSAQTEAPSATTFGSDVAPTTQPNSNSTRPAPSTTIETPPTTENLPSTTIAGETLSISPESLPTSIDDPAEWVERVYGLLTVIYNDTRWEMFDYVYNGGIEGSFGAEYAPDIGAVKSFRESYPNEYFRFESSVVEERTTTSQYVISVDETRSFMENSTRSIIDYGVLPKTVRIDDNGASKEIELYLINRAEVICVYDENGVCV